MEKEKQHYRGEKIKVRMNNASRISGRVVGSLGSDIILLSNGKRVSRSKISSYE